MPPVRSFAWLVLLSALGRVAVAQTPTAEVTGRVTDQTGAVVIGARLIVIGADTGVKRETTSNDQGNYTIPLLNPGNYQITVMKEGFRPINRSGIAGHPRSEHQFPHRRGGAPHRQRAVGVTKEQRETLRTNRRSCFGELDNAATFNPS